MKLGKSSELPPPTTALANAPKEDQSATETPSLRRRWASALYDGILLSAVLLVATFPFVAFTQGVPAEQARWGLRLYTFLVTGLYFTMFWHKGQTLAMKTWRFRIESASGGPPTWKQLWLRYILACALLACAGLGWWIAIFRCDRQFLHDRLAGTWLRNVGQPGEKA